LLLFSEELAKRLQAAEENLAAQAQQQQQLAEQQQPGGARERQRGRAPGQRPEQRQPQQRSEKSKNVSWIRPLTCQLLYICVTSFCLPGILLTCRGLYH